MILVREPFPEGARWLNSMGAFDPGATALLASGCLKEPKQAYWDEEDKDKEQKGGRRPF